MREIKKIFIAHGWTEVGLNIQTISVAKAASELYDIIYLTQPRIGKSETQFNEHLKIIEWPNKRPGKFKDFLFLIKLVRKERPDLILVHFGATNICMIVSWLMRIKFRVCWMHTLSSQYYLDSTNIRKAKLAISFRKIAYRMATHIVIQNEVARNDAIENYKVSTGKIFKIYNGIRQYGLPVLYENKIKSFRYSGRLDESKGIDILLKAFAIVYKDNKNSILEIAGKGSEEAFIKTFIQKEGLENAIVFHGYFSDYNKAVNFISGAYCLLLPSRSDNFPTVVLEALSFGVPVIASNTGGIPEMFEDGKEGYLVPMENVEALAEAMQKLIANANLRNEMSIQARNTFLRKYSMERHVAHVIEFIEQLKQPN